MGDPDLQLPEVVGDGVVLLAGAEAAQRLELQRVPALRCVGAEHQEDRGMGQDGQLGPDGQ
jgi:hypothetical protein